MHIALPFDGMPGLLALILLVVGLCWGSFAATVSERWPQGRSIVQPRSRCDACHRILAARDLVPVLSYAVSRGRCRTCSASIPVRYPFIELACGAIGMISAFTLPGTDGLWVAIFGWQLFLLAILDAEHFWLPDPLVAVLGLTGLAAAAMIGADALWDRSLGGVMGFASLFLIGALYRRLRGRDGLGGGDPKLFGAIGLWTGWQTLPLILLTAAVMGLIFAIATIRSESRGAWLQRRLPFGVCLAAAAWLTTLVGS